MAEKIELPREIQPREIPAVKCDEKMMVNLGVKVQEDGTVVPDESNLVDLDAMIQTYKDQCGMELAKRLIKLGQAAPEDFADDGKGSFDDSAIPPTSQARANAAVAAKAQLDAIKDVYGIPKDVELTDAQYDALVKDFVEKNIDKFVAKATEKPTEGGNE